MKVMNYLKREIKRLWLKFKRTELFLHETKRYSLNKFFIILLIVFSYFIFVSFKFGIRDGFMVTLLTWSFFVFCTPIADAGFLLDFPLRLLTGIRMLLSELGVWTFALIINLFCLGFIPKVYEKTILLKLFKQILLHPIPYWSIILISALGTFMSVYFGDELLDVAKHVEREKYHKHKFKYGIIVILFLFILIFLLYEHLLIELGIRI